MAAEIVILSAPRLDESYVGFLTSLGMVWQPTSGSTEAEKLIEFAGRTCYMSFGPERQAPGTTIDYIRKLIANGHESVLEHASWTLVISGVTRAFTHQLVRHRVGFSFSQLSQQYHEESEARFLPPPGLSKDSPDHAEWKASLETVRRVYKKLLANITPYPEMSAREMLRLRRSIARSILPNATETVVVLTANARSIRHFLKVRGNVPGDLEMRLVTANLLALLRPQAPAVFADFETRHLDDGFPMVVQLDGAFADATG